MYMKNNNPYDDTRIGKIKDQDGAYIDEDVAYDNLLNGTDSRIHLSPIDAVLQPFRCTDGSIYIPIVQGDRLTRNEIIKIGEKYGFWVNRSGEKIKFKDIDRTYAQNILNFTTRAGQHCPKQIYRILGIKRGAK
jgi:hypothetical protein